jgi:hypothetical protein
MTTAASFRPHRIFAGMAADQGAAREEIGSRRQRRRRKPKASRKVSKKLKLRLSVILTVLIVAVKRSCEKNVESIDVVKEEQTMLKMLL